MATITNHVALRLLVALGAVVPVAGGFWGVVEGLNGANAWPAGHYRYLSGLLLAIGLGFWSTVPQIERHARRFRLLTAIVFLGGLCRLFGVLIGDPLTISVVAALVMELLVTPIACLWQGRVSISSPCWGPV